MTRLLLTIALVCLAATTFGAKAAEKPSAAALARDPARFLNHQLRIDKLGCFFSPEAGYRCTTYGGVYVLPGDIAPADVKTKIKADCGGIVEDEDDPSCLFDLVFTPSAVGRGVGQIVKGDRSAEGPVWMVHAAFATLTPHH